MTLAAYTQIHLSSLDQGKRDRILEAINSIIVAVDPECSPIHPDDYPLTNCYLCELRHWAIDVQSAILARRSEPQPEEDTTDDVDSDPALD